MSSPTIAIIGLGYVGLPLAVEFARKYPVTGFDVNAKRIEELKSFHDSTGQISRGLLEEITGGPYSLKLTGSLAEVAASTIFIITVPTPVDKTKQPDLSFLIAATKQVAAVLKPGDLVIYESTVYPGCTEEECVPVLERISGLTYNKEFYCGYSPERINVGDTVNTLVNIKKVTSGSTPEIARKVDELYASIIKAGTFPAASIKVAEASKAIENAQRDLNISFVNELALIFDKMGIDTEDVLEAAGTKWNFLKYKPGLVGGHCIGVDPYYLTYKAEQLGYVPRVISSGRKVNEDMGGFIARKVVAMLEQKGKRPEDSTILVLGITFKENCSDIRNSGVIGLYEELRTLGAAVKVFDPRADSLMVAKEYSVPLLPEINYIINYDAVILAVAHDEFKKIDFERFKAGGAIIYDIKWGVERSIADARL